jgi:DNA-binding GntR family transcriptional regulator
MEKKANINLLKNQAYEGIKERIINLTLRPNEQLVEQRLAEQLGISKSPIREAIQRLEREGLIYSLPFRGGFAAAVSEQDIREIFQLREALERFCIKNACLIFSGDDLKKIRKIISRSDKALQQGDIKEAYLIDIQLHDFLINSSNNGKLIQTYANLRDHLTRYWNIASLISGRVAKSHQEHLLILEAIAQRDESQAEKRISEHLHSILEEFIQSKEFRAYCRNS